MSVNNITFYQILKTIKKGQVMGFQETNFIPLLSLHVIFLANYRQAYHFGCQREREGEERVLPSPDLHFIV